MTTLPAACDRTHTYSSRHAAHGRIERDPLGTRPHAHEPLHSADEPLPLHLHVLVQDHQVIAGHDHVAEGRVLDPQERRECRLAFPYAEHVTCELGRRLDHEHAGIHGLAGEMPRHPELVVANVLEPHAPRQVVA